MSSYKWVELGLAILPATVLVGIALPLGLGGMAGLFFAAAAHIARSDYDGLALDLDSMTWLAGSVFGTLWGVVALWVVTLRSSDAVARSRRVRWFVLLGLVAGLLVVAYWLMTESLVRSRFVLAYPLVAAGLAGMRNLVAMAVHLRRGHARP